MTCAIHCGEVIDDGEGVDDLEDDDIFFWELMPHVAADVVPEP
jgi:hypothetical protein